MKRLNKCILLLFITLLLGISTATAFEVSPANPTVGDEITISGTGSGDSVDASVQFTVKEVDVDDGEYGYRINDVKIPKGSDISVTAEKVENLNVRVKIGLWMTESADDQNSDEKVTISQSNMPLGGTFDIRIDGNAAPGTDSVDLTVKASVPIEVNNGVYRYEYDTNSIPPGQFKVTVAGDSKTITLNPSGGGDGTSGSSSGGGGGSTPDNSDNNVDAEELSTKRVFSNTPVEYQFSDPEVPVKSINLTSAITVMDVPVRIEVLKDVSVMVKKEPKGNIYKHINIWVGNSGFAIPENIKSAKVHFQVENNWIEDNNIEPESVVLMHYDKDTDHWTRLPTDMLSSNEVYTVYQASATYFSPFAISGQIDQEIIDNTTDESQNSTVNSSNITDQNSTGKTDNQSFYTNAWIFGLILTGFAGIIILKMRKS